jgi:hypothetical protein
MAEMEDFKFPDEIEAKKDGGEVESNIEIEIEDDTPEEDRGRTPMPKELVEELEKDELDQYDDKVKTRLKQMRKVWHDERREKEAALREQQEAVSIAKRLWEENKRYQTMIEERQKHLAESEKTVAEKELEEAKAALKAAHEAFDMDAIVQAQQNMQVANLKLYNLKAEKPALQEQNNQVHIQQPVAQPVAPDSKTVAWARRNPWFGANEEMTALALGLHQKLEKQGVVVGSDDYFAAVDKTMRRRFPEAFEDAEEKPVKTKTLTVVAPATRSTAPKKISLRQSQRNLAKKFGITDEQYALEVLKLEANNG